MLYFNFCFRIRLIGEHVALGNGFALVSKIIPQLKENVPISVETTSAALNLTRELVQVSLFFCGTVLANNRFKSSIHELTCMLSCM
jgi:hypothetical protein